MPRTPLILIPLLLAACSSNARYAELQEQRAQSKLARLIGERAPGTPQNCLDTRLTNGFEAAGAKTVLYFEGDTVWRNDLTGQCTGLRVGDTLVTEQTTGRLCRGDFARTVSPTGGFVTGNCVVGQFVPYRPN
jgi:hypothetical protein